MFDFLQQLITSCEATFGNAILHIPIGRTGSDGRIARTLACHNSTEPFHLFEAEPHFGGSTRCEDAYDFCKPYLKTTSFHNALAVRTDLTVFVVLILFFPT